MITGIDHFIVAVPDPDDAAAELEGALGLQAGPGGRHEAYGSHNRLIWLGDSYIELLGISDAALASSAWFGPKALSVLEESGAGYVGMSLASDDLVADMVALRGLRSALREPESGERARTDGRVVRWKVATGPEPDPELGHLFLIEHDTTAAEWTAEERAERATQLHPAGPGLRLVRVELPVRDMPAVTMRLHRDLGLQFRPSLVGGGARDATVGTQIVRLLRAGRGVLPTVVVRGGTMSRAAIVFDCRWLVEGDGA